MVRASQYSAVKVGNHCVASAQFLRRTLYPPTGAWPWRPRARPSLVNDDHWHGLASVTMNANSTGLVIGENAAVIIAEGLLSKRCRRWTDHDISAKRRDRKLRTRTHTEGFENTQR